MGFVKYPWEIPQEIVNRYSSMVIELPTTGEIVDIERTGPVYSAEDDAVLFLSQGTLLAETYLPSRWAFIWQNTIVELEGSYEIDLVDRKSLIFEMTFSLDTAIPDDSQILKSPEGLNLIRQALYTWLSPSRGTVRSLTLNGVVGRLIAQHTLEGN